MVRGEIYFLDLAPRSGSEEKGRRPCILVSHDAFTSNPRWASATVVPLTTSPRWQVPSPTVVLFQAGECGLPKSCAALAHQVTTVDKSKMIGPPIGKLTPAKQSELEQSLRNYLVL
ncbi:MAG: type II toxin-antitoxin system PemK/MazF family toxin [Nitrospirae bacterium]|nr:type II toxin-antitoxin system PemK/MazF family toxin [Nitrospirota bacterium]